MSELPQPPWVYSPDEVRKWQFSVASPVKKVEKGKIEKKLEDIKIKIWLKCKKEEKFFEVEEDFDVSSTSLVILKAFSNAKFKKVVRMEIDGVAHKTNDKIKDAINEWGSNKVYKKIIFVLDDKNRDIRIYINRKHLIGHPSIIIHFKGTIHISRYHRILNYLKNHLPVEGVIKE